MNDATRTFAATNAHGRTLYRYVLSGHAGHIRLCERWHESDAVADADALVIAREWGGKRSLKVRLVYPVPTMPQSRHAAAGSP